MYLMMSMSNESLIRTIINFKENKFQDQTLFYFGKMVDNGTALLNHLPKLMNYCRR